MVRKKILLSMQCIKIGAIGGVEAAVYNLGRALIVAGAELTVVGRRALNIHEDVYNEFVAKGVTIIDNPIENRFVSEVLTMSFVRGRYDMTVFPNYFAPPWLPKRFGRLCVVVHDLQYKSFPNNFPLSKRIWLESCFIYLAHRKCVIVFISEFSKKTFCSTFDIPPSKGRVIGNCVSFERFSKNPLSDEVDKVRRLGVDNGNYILCVGHRFKHKNVETLMSAFLAQYSNEPSVKLVLVGQHPFRLGNVQRYRGSLGDSASSCKERDVGDHHPGARHGIIDLGYVSDAMLGLLIRESKFLVLPTLYEGFGLPLVEGIGLGARLLVSDIPPFREVCQQGPAMVRDYSSQCAWTRGIEDMLRNEALGVTSEASIRNVISNYSPKNIGLRYIKLLDNWPSS